MAVHHGTVTVDALLLLSFGGPEGPDDVRPFLENVTRGRGVPPERLDEVAEHYHRFGGVSPINQLNRQLLSALTQQLKSSGRDLPIYFGNRNWHPFAEDTLADMTKRGVRKALVFATSAWGGYSGCKQYQEDIARVRASVGDDAPELVKLRQFFDHPLFIEANADAVRAARGGLPAEQRDQARVVFVAHSIPDSADALPSPDGRPHWYSRQVRESARLVAEQLGVNDYDVVWQSRSGPPHVPWLEPDISDHLHDLHQRGVSAVVCSPIGFVSDHLEVIWDLDNEAAETAAELGMGWARAATAGTDERFVVMIDELIGEHLDADRSTERPAKLSPLPAAGCTTNGAACVPGCCQRG